MPGLQTTTSALLLSLLLAPASVNLTARVVAAQTTSKAAINSEERQRGIELYRQAKFVEAANLLQRFVKQNRSDSEAWYYLGLTLLQQPQKAKEASKAFESSLKLRPSFAPAHAGLAYSLLVREKTNDALREAQQAISIDPGIPDAHYARGVALLRFGNSEEALKEANKAIDLDPKPAAPYLLKSQALVTLQSVPLAQDQNARTVRVTRYGEAADALERYLQLSSDSEAKRTWGDQLEALRFYVSVQSKKNTETGPIDPSEATVRARILSKPEPQYTESARQDRVMGTVILRAVLAADGSVSHILVIKGLPQGLTQRSVKAAQLIKFVPAMRNGRPVSTFVQLEYNFNLF